MSNSQPPIKSPNSPSRKGSPKDCDECGRRFRPWVKGGKFCSVQCRSMSWSRRLRTVREPKPAPITSPERLKAIQDEARAALDNLRKRLDG
ncbi:hypothetical protein HUN58_13795 [Curtobacterium sp. Csp1]|nr:hypothetical protein HUN58_13795 [Curtobacterium sp. Csp1]